MYMGEVYQIVRKQTLYAGSIIFLQKSCHWIHWIKWEHLWKKTLVTSMHSSRMHTTCLLPISPSMHCRGMCAPRGVSAPKGVYPSMQWGRHCPPWTDKHLWKHNLRKFCLPAVIMLLCWLGNHGTGQEWLIQTWLIWSSTNSKGI